MVRVYMGKSHPTKVKMTKCKSYSLTRSNISNLQEQHTDLQCQVTIVNTASNKIACIVKYFRKYIICSWFVYGLGNIREYF